MAVDGDVVAVHSEWTRDGSRIVTRATVRTPDGRDVVVTQRGGVVDGVAQITMPGPPPLVLGMKVAIAAHRAVDLSSREHVVADGVKVLAYPPGFVRSGPTEAGNPLYWESGCALVTIDEAGTTAIAGDDELAAIDAAIAEWNTKTDACSYMKIVNDGRRRIEVSGKDGINAIKFRDTPCECMTETGKPFASWCTPATEDAPQECHGINVAGLATMTYSIEAARDGAILDADIELNAVTFRVSIAPDLGEPEDTRLNAVLQNTLTHELGHLLGLEHTCVNLGDPPRLDGDGNEVTSCDFAGIELQDTTMFPSQESGETKKMSLSQDDIDGICRIYPRASDPQVCAPVSVPEAAGCCSASGRSGNDVSFLLAGAAALLLLRRRKTSPDA
jgi:hypothetical protein